MNKLLHKIKNFTNAYNIYILTAILLLGITITCFWNINSNNKISDLKVSHESGFYDKPFYLTIKGNPKYNIYYTLDCSKPTPENGTKYEKPIFIQDASLNKNVYSKLKDISLQFKKISYF